MNFIEFKYYLYSFHVRIEQIVNWGYRDRWAGKCFRERREGKVEPIKVIFQSMEDCQKFVIAVENYPFNIDLQSGRQIIDGKSILGILGFGLYRTLDLRLHTDDEKLAEEILNKIEFCICRENMSIAI